MLSFSYFHILYFYFSYFHISYFWASVNLGLHICLFHNHFHIHFHHIHINHISYELILVFGTNI